MNKAQWTDLFREIKKNTGRYLSLLFIVALGTAFFAGVRSAEPDMIASADKYYDESNLMDVRILGTLGLTEDDVSAIAKTEGIDQAEGGYSIETMARLNDNEFVINVMSPCKNMNQMTIWDGRMPEAENECFMDEGFMIYNGLELGDTITLVDEDGETPENLKHSTYTIVGSGTWSWYLSWARGSASIGDGSLDAFMVVPESSFDLDYYTVIYAMVHGVNDLNSFSETYDDAVKLVTERIEEIAGERCNIRYSEVYEDAEKALNDARQEVSDGVKELADAEKQLQDGEEAYEEGKLAYEKGLKEYKEGQRAYENGKKQIEQAKKDLDAGQKAYSEGLTAIQQGEKELKAGKEEIKSQEEEIAQAEKQIKEGKTACESAEKEIAQAESVITEQEASFKEAESSYESQLSAYQSEKAKLDSLSSQISETKNELTEKENEKNALWEYVSGLEENSEEFDRYNQQLEDLKAEIAELEAELETLQSQYDQLSAELTPVKAKLDEAKEELNKQRTQLNEAKEELAANKKQLAAKKEELAVAEKQVSEGKKAIASAKTEMEQAEKIITSKKKELEAAKTQLDAGEKEYQTGLKELRASEKTLKSAKQELDDGEKELLESRQKLEDGWKEYKDAAEEANKKLDEARQQIAEGEEDLIALKEGEWYVLGRDTLQNSVEFSMDAERIGAIGKVLPIIFFLVAALVSLTTMTRMIEEERTLIGTMKALGYSKFAISGKYIIYAGSATLVGGIIGVILGSKLLPSVIMLAYSMLYSNIQYVVTPLHLELCISAIGLALLCTVGATILACYKELLATPASLMRPPVPKKGKRLILEKIPFLWNKLNFSMKSTVRNLVRYKKRFFMTVFGIGGCMAILLVSFGLSDSIGVISDRQYRSIWQYSASCIIDEDEKPEVQKEQLNTIVNGNPYIENAMLARQISLDVSTDKAEKTAFFFIPEDNQAMKDYVDLHERESGKQHTLSDEGVILSEKLATSLGVAEGNLITIQFDKTDRKEVKVSAITENYMNHYIYMSSALYKQIQGEAPEYNQIFLNFTDEIEDESIVAEYLLEQDMVMQVTLVKEMQKSIDDMMNALNLVVWVLIVAAGLLVFVVLYNLNNINISERRRELASLKVLGFYNNEVAMYVYRENIILTLIGIIVGMFMGTWLHQYLILTLEVEMIMFGRQIDPFSYLFSMILTIIFAVLVNVTMYRKLKQIDMIESLKSVE